MTKVKELANLNVLFLILVVAAAGYYSHSFSRSSVQAPVFTYTEAVQPKPIANTIVQPIIKKAIVPVPQPTASLPILSPRVLYSILPEYPASAMEKGIEGKVLVQARINNLGAVEKTQIKESSSYSELDAEALRAVSLWKFSPATQGGSAISSIFEVPVRFSLK